MHTMLLYLIMPMGSTMGQEILVDKNFRRWPFPTKIKPVKYFLCNEHQSIPILVAKVWWQNLDYMKNLQVKYLPVKISQSTVFEKYGSY